MGRCWRALVGLEGPQIRSLFAIAMLLGIVALSVESWAMTALAHAAASGGDADGPWFGLVIRRLRYLSMLQGFFALVAGLVVFGADYFRVKLGDREVGAGKGAGA